MPRGQFVVNWFDNKVLKTYGSKYYTETAHWATAKSTVLVLMCFCNVSGTWDCKVLERWPDYFTYFGVIFHC